MPEKTPEQSPRQLLAALCAPFSCGDVDWIVVATDKDKQRGLVAPYIRAKPILRRLDDVMGPTGWRMDFHPAGDAGIICTLYLRLDREWIGKGNGAEYSQRASVRGGCSNALKRAARMWGIGAYLDGLKNEWVPVVKRGESWAPTEVPVIPDSMLPENERGMSGGATHRDAGSPQHHAPRPAANPAPRAPHSAHQPSRIDPPAPGGKAAHNPQIVRFIRELALKLGLSEDDLKARCGRHGAESLEQLSAPDAASLHEELRKELRDKERR